MRVLERHVAGAFAEGKRVVVLAESADDSLVSAVLARTGRGDRDGQVDVRAAPDVYLSSGRFDADRSRALLEAHKRAALADGFAGVHIVSDMSWAAADAGSVDNLPAYERAAGALFADGRASALCQYDRRRFPARAVAACAAAHQGFESAFDEVEMLADGRVAVDIGRHGSVRASGEIDMANVALLRQALATAAERSDDVCVDASGLTFIDVCGLNALFDAARTGGIALLAPRSPLCGMLDALDAPRQLPGLETGC